MEPQYNEPLYTEVLDITNDFLYPSNGKTYGKERRCNETDFQNERRRCIFSKGVQGQAPPGNVFDFNSLKSPFLGLQDIQTGVWPDFYLEIVLLLSLLLLWKIWPITVNKTVETDRNLFHFSHLVTRTNTASGRELSLTGIACHLII